MKKLIIPVLAGLGLVCTFVTLDQEYTENITREFTLQKEGSQSTMAVYNVFGFVRVEGYNGDKVLCSVKKTISGENSSDIEKGKSEVTLDFIQNADSIVAFITEPFDTRPRKHISNNRDHKIDYNFRLDFTVKVPYDMNLTISTILSGDIEITSVNGKLDVHHVNGAITLNDIKGITNARTVNGNIYARYASNPHGESSYTTINGDINVHYKPGLSADMQFKSMTGEFFTDFPEAKLQPNVVTKSKTEKENTTVYKIDNVSNIRFGEGGWLYNFETLNGNVYIKNQL